MFKAILASGVASLGMVGALAAKGEAQSSRVFGDRAIKRVISENRKSRKHVMSRGSIADKPHQHRREIARRTTKPGTPERRAAMEAARHGR